MSLGNTENSEHNISFITLLQFLPGEVLEVLLKDKLLLFCQTSTKMKEILNKAKIKLAIRFNRNYKLNDDLLYKFNSFNTWCEVTTLILCNCKLSDDNIQPLVKILHINTTLQYLNVRWNCIGDNGARLIAEALCVNNTLQYLNLSYNCIKNDGAKAFIDALSINNTLQRLNFYNNFIGPDEKKRN